MSDAPQPRKGDELDDNLGMTSSFKCWPTIPRDRPLAEAIGALVEDELEALCRKRELLARLDEAKRVSGVHNSYEYSLERCRAIQAELDKGSADD